MGSERAEYLLGPEVGADDLLERPSRAADLRALLRARLRNVPASTPVARKYRFGQVEVDFGAFQASGVNGQVRLTRTELAILLRLISSRGEVVSREQLVQELWGPHAFPTTRTVDIHILNLRKKLEPDPSRARFILTVHGVGYRFAG
jgi:two-component system alkaline phosphatase synthesis response regulator PhoP